MQNVPGNVQSAIALDLCPSKCDSHFVIMTVPGESSRVSRSTKATSKFRVAKSFFAICRDLGSREKITEYERTSSSYTLSASNILKISDLLIGHTSLMYVLYTALELYCREIQAL